MTLNQDNPLKCEEALCWHVKSQGYIYCICCLYGRCFTIPEEERILATPVEEGEKT